MSNCFFYLSAYPTEKTAIMITMATRRPIQQRTKENPKNKPKYIYVDREGGTASEGERQRERERLKMQYLSHYSDWARGWTVEILGFEQAREG
jgi:hypothetical protein